MNLDLSFLSVDERGNIIPKTPEAALVAAQAYLFTTQPTPGDPREHMHRATLQGLGLVGDKLKQETKHRVVTGEPTSLDPRTKTSRHAVTIVLDTGARLKITISTPRRYNSPRQGRSRRSKSPRYAYHNDDDEIEMGEACFTRRVCRALVPKGFNLPHDQQKYDGSQEPPSWLSDYLQAIKMLGGSKETAMQNLQLHLTTAARSWLGKLKKEIIRSSDELAKQFIGNFKSTYKRPASTEKLKACIQKLGETLCSYIQRSSIIKNSAKDVSDERAIDAFMQGLRRADFVEEMDRIKPKTMAELMDVAIRFTDREDAYQNKRTRSLEDDRLNRYNNQRRRSRNYDNYGSHSQVAAGYKKTTIKMMTTKIVGITMMIEMTRAATSSSGQGVQENTINRQTICSMDPAICITRMSTEKEYQGMQ
jgi:hypothetical protein